MATLGRLKHLENTFKILIMGDASVGKTSILTRNFPPICTSFRQDLWQKNLYLRTSDRFIVVGWHQFISLDPGSLGFQRFLGEGIREALLIKHNKQ